MKILLPNKKGEINNPEIDSRVIVVIGANGSGKSRFGTEIEKTYSDEVHRISAQKSLKMPEQITTTALDEARREYLYGSK